MFHLFRALFCLYVVIRFIMPLPWPRWIKIVIGVMLMIVFQHSFISLLVFGTMFSPEVPRVVMIGANWLSGTVIFLALFQIVMDIGLLATMLIRRKRLGIPTWCRYGTGALALSIAAFAVSQAIKVPDVKEVEITIPGLPEQFDGYRMIQLTDLHISRLFEAPWVEETVAKANAQKADLIVITGDLIDGDLQARIKDIAPIGKLSAADGVYAIPGNHEYYFGHDGWMEKFVELGLKTISNGHVVLERNGGRLVLAGVNDFVAPRFNMPPPDIDKALDGAPADLPVILLNHQPREARKMAAAGVDLQLSGHTHGGMILGFNQIVAQFNGGFVSGLYQVGDMQLYVNNGTALWLGFALRLGVPSELTVITLRTKN